jgi:hypothetical protein
MVATLTPVIAASLPMLTSAMIDVPLNL